MIPIDQTIFGPPSGNCFPACIASIMERPLWTVPNFCIDLALGKADWYDRFTNWVVAEGWAVLMIRPPVFDVSMPQNAVVIATGLSPRRGDYPAMPNMLHCVVHGRGAKLMHDPHPSRDGIDGNPVCWELLWKP